MFISPRSGYVIYTNVVGKSANALCLLMRREQIKEIAGNLEMGFKCFIHKDFLEMVFIPAEENHPDMEIETWKKELKAIQKARNKYLEIEGMDSRDSFRVMEEFIGSLDDKPLRDSLTKAIERPKPFANFKLKIDCSGPSRDKWVVFKESKLLEYVERQLLQIKV